MCFFFLLNLFNRLNVLDKIRRENFKVDWVLLINYRDIEIV